MGQDGSKPNVSTLFLFEDVLFSLRGDIGHSNKGLSQGDLLALFVNDIDKYVDRLDKMPPHDGIDRLYDSEFQETHDG